MRTPQDEERQLQQPHIVKAGHSRLKDGVASARLCPAIHVLLRSAKNVDARDKPGHDAE